MDLIYPQQRPPGSINSAPMLPLLRAAGGATRSSGSTSTNAAPPPTGQTATTPPSCCSPLSAAGRTPPSSARCLQTRAATPRADPYLLKCLASPNLTHQQSAARLFSRAWINRLPSGVNWLFTAAGGDDARPYQSGTGHRRQRFYVSRVRSKVRYWMASRT